MATQSQMEAPPASFAWLLRQMRGEARLTQEELAYKAGLSSRAISDLERGISRTARKDTAILLADALAISASARAAFIAVARGRAPVSDVLCALEHAAAYAPGGRTDRQADEDAGFSPHEIELFERLIEAMTALRRELAALWRGSGWSA
jgi:transcriptional regulator with XRE-family HTH domain